MTCPLVTTTGARSCKQHCDTLKGALKSTPTRGDTERDGVSTKVRRVRQSHPIPTRGRVDDSHQPREGLQSPTFRARRGGQEDKDRRGHGIAAPPRTHTVGARTVDRPHGRTPLTRVLPDRKTEAVWKPWCCRHSPGGGSNPTHTTIDHRAS
jgi:hypothetical protein